MASIHSSFAGRHLIFEFINKELLPIGQYKICQVEIDNLGTEFKTMGSCAQIKRDLIKNLSPHKTHKIS